MKKNTFSIKEALDFGWETFSNNLWFFLGLMFVLSLIFAFVGILQEVAKAMNPALFVLINVVALVVNIIVGIGLIRISVGFIHHQKSSVRQAFMPTSDTFFPYVVGAFMYAVIVIFGTILLVVPGIIWAVKYQFFGYFILDQKSEPKEALKDSARITDGARWKIFGFLIVLTVLNIIGAMLFGIGLLVTIPVTILSSAFVYQKLKLNIESNTALERIDPSAHNGKVTA